MRKLQESVDEQTQVRERLVPRADLLRRAEQIADVLQLRLRLRRALDGACARAAILVLDQLRQHAPAHLCEHRRDARRRVGKLIDRERRTPAEEGVGGRVGFGGAPERDQAEGPISIGLARCRRRRRGRRDARQFGKRFVVRRRRVQIASRLERVVLGRHDRRRDQERDENRARDHCGLASSHLLRSTATRFTPRAVTTIRSVRSPSCGWRNVTSCGPTASDRFDSGVCPTISPSIRTSAHGRAFTLRAPFGGSISTAVTRPGATVIVRGASKPTLSLRSTTSCLPAASMIFAPLMPTTSSRSTTSTGNGDATVTHPATGAVGRGIENTTSVTTPFDTAIVRWATPLSDITVIRCSAAASPSITTGDRPCGRPSTSTLAPAGSVTIDSRPAAVRDSIGLGSSRSRAPGAAAGAARTFGNQARTAPKLPAALTSTTAAINSEVDPNANVEGRAGDTGPGLSSAGAMDRTLLSGGARASRGTCFRTSYVRESNPRYCTAVIAL